MRFRHPWTCFWLLYIFFDETKSHFVSQIEKSITPPRDFFFGKSKKTYIKKKKRKEGWPIWCVPCLFDLLWPALLWRLLFFLRLCRGDVNEVLFGPREAYTVCGKKFDEGNFKLRPRATSLVVGKWILNWRIPLLFSFRRQGGGYGRKSNTVFECFQNFV